MTGKTGEGGITPLHLLHTHNIALVVKTKIVRCMDLAPLQAGKDVENG